MKDEPIGLDTDTILYFLLNQSFFSVIKEFNLELKKNILSKDNVTKMYFCICFVTKCPRHVMCLYVCLSLDNHLSRFAVALSFQC